MVKAYYRDIAGRAYRNTVRAVTGETHGERLVRVATVGFGLIVAWAYVHWWNQQSSLFNDGLLGAGLGLIVLGALVFAGLVLNFLFVAPYQLWAEERARAESAEAGLGPAFSARLEEHLSEDRAHALRLLGLMMSKLVDPPTSWDDIKNDVRAMRRLMHTIGETTESGTYRVDLTHHYEMFRQAQAVVMDSSETATWQSEELQFHAVMYRLAASALDKWLRGRAQPGSFDEYRRRVEGVKLFAPDETSYSLTPAPGADFKLIRKLADAKPT